MSISLVILAAGMGSRFGGAKQIEPIGPNGEFIIDYSVIDAVRAGFDRVVFVIKKDIEEYFMQTIFKRASKICDCSCVYQSLDDLPDGFEVPEGRTRPWGTGHAALSARTAVDTPFAVINADDFYGRGAFFELAKFLKPLALSKQRSKICMVGYKLCNTISEHGSVSRGVCAADENGNLKSINERTNIYKRDNGLYFSENEIEYPLERETIVSMNCFGFTQDFFVEGENLFGEFLHNIQDEKTSEFYLPYIPNCLVEKRLASVKLLSCDEKWYGFTYREDRETVVNAISVLTEKGVY